MNETETNHTKSETNRNIRCFVIGCLVGTLLTGMGAGLVSLRQYREWNGKFAEQQQRATELEQRLNDSVKRYDDIARQYDDIKQRLDATKQAIADDCRRADQILSRDAQSISALRAALTELKAVLRNLYSNSIRDGDDYRDIDTTQVGNIYILPSYGYFMEVQS